MTLYLQTDTIVLPDFTEHSSLEHIHVSGLDLVPLGVYQGQGDRFDAKIKDALWEKRTQMIVSAFRTLRTLAVACTGWTVGGAGVYFRHDEFKAAIEERWTKLGHILTKCTGLEVFEIHLIQLPSDLYDPETFLPGKEDLRNLHTLAMCLPKSLRQILRFILSDGKEKTVTVRQPEM